MTDRKAKTMGIQVRNVSDIINKVSNMKLDAVEEAIKEEFPKLVLKAIRIHDHYLRSETDPKKQKIAETILRLSVDEKFWAALKSMSFGDGKRIKEEKVNWEKQPTGVGG